ncbi:hypothetical protein RRG08_031975 [Elysia crispata]|uniref:Uncharacterized protein n=1 Tax=Elysia crispata TaxID=231223 RepID=A0AAE0Z3V7_9GAST|nr:hypothetical protein RRG08_031975 [Elysia crispata]
MRIAFIICLAFHIMSTDSDVTSTPNTPRECADKFREATFLAIHEPDWCSAAEEYATCINDITNLEPQTKMVYRQILRSWLKDNPSCNVESLIYG